MAEFADDPRFAHIATDPRFKAMPKSKKKVKIDSRFQTLFTSRHFTHRTDMDKRGRPILDTKRKNKHTMEKFYKMSDSDEDDSDAESEDEDNNDNNEVDQDQDENDKNDDLSHDINDIGLISSERKIKKSSCSSKNKSHVGKTKEPLKCQELISKVKPELSQNAQKKKLNKLDKKGATDRQQPMKEKQMINTAPGEKLDDNDKDYNSCSAASESDENAVKADEDESDSDDEEDDDEEELPEYSEKYNIQETGLDHKWNELQNDATEVSESTRRLAVCNMDWDFVKAQDLYVLVKSFVPDGGSVLSVAIYPSEFGKERMAEEAQLGPKEMRGNGEGSGDDDDVGKGNKNKNKKGKGVDQKKEKSLKKERDGVHQEKLREYQLNRLRYYYAVVECDSVRTADVIYSECDGREYQLSSVRLDLRFIPDDMTFEDEPREMFSEGQTTVDYQPSSFQSSALSLAKVEVTWDETEFDRLSRRVSAMQHKDLETVVEDNKFADIIAPPESDSEGEDEEPEWLKKVLSQNEELSDEDEEGEEEGGRKAVSEEKKIKLYRKLLMDKLAEEEEEKQKEEDDVDMVMEWQPGLKTSVEKKLKKKEKKKEETAVVSQYLEKRKEKKKKKRDQKKQQVTPEEAAESFSDDDLPADLDIDDSLREMMKGEDTHSLNHVDKKKKKKKKVKDEEENNEEDENEKAELELMLMGDGSGKHVSKPQLVDQSKSKKRKSKKQMAKLKKAAQQEEEDFVLDVEDHRFSALFTSHHFHIDPTAPQFKKTKNMSRLVDEQVKRKKKTSLGKKRSLDISEGGDNESRSAGSSRSVSQSLVESLKKKMKKS